MRFMFSDADLANPDTSGFNTSSVTDMQYMFHRAYAANPDTSNWDVSSVENMSFMFYQTGLADPDTSSWVITSVTNLAEMFRDATGANPDVSTWDMSSVLNVSNMFNNSGLSKENYDMLLNSWGSQTLQPGLTFHAGTTEYCIGEGGRQTIEAAHSWTIVDGGKDCSELILAEILEDSASAGGSNNANGTFVTAAELAEIDGLSFVFAGNEADYQTAIAAATNLSNPPLVAEVQSLIDSINGPCDIVTDVSAAECEALVDFYE